ncbi:MAG: hypothetical protein OEM32_04820 [Acidimicrobiia bacterium]|nr:hypothetical protein [Acidimicrobiia bacterium]
MRRVLDCVVVLACWLTIGGVAVLANYPGQDCLSCHSSATVGGTVYADEAGTTTLPGVALSLMTSDGHVVDVGVSNSVGNIRSFDVPEGNYRVQLGSISSKAWHNIPAQSSCNTCHVVGGNSSQLRTKQLPEYHNGVPPGNRCVKCHHFPASMFYGQLRTPGVLVGNKPPPSNDPSFVELSGTTYDVDPDDLADIQTVRPDIFMPGYFSAFDVILRVAADNGIAIEYTWDESAKTHWITSVDDVAGAYWYGWSNDSGQSSPSELDWRRGNRWDELLWRKGTKLRLNVGLDDLPGLREAFHQEIGRETASGGTTVGVVELLVNATDYQGNPPGSGRISASLTLPNVPVTAHDLRAAIPGPGSNLPRPYQPGVVTSMDILFSLEDAGEIDNVSTVFIERIATSLVQSYFLQGFGFPGVGHAHASGNHGLTGRTHLLAEGAVYDGANSQNVNAAPGILHVPQDILPIHAPDYSLWRWREFGPP